jgi:hypothetical protein
MFIETLRECFIFDFDVTIFLKLFIYISSRISITLAVTAQRITLLSAEGTLIIQIEWNKDKKKRETHVYEYMIICKDKKVS